MIGRPRQGDTLVRSAIWSSPGRTASASPTGPPPTMTAEALIRPDPLIAPRL